MYKLKYGIDMSVTLPYFGFKYNETFGWWERPVNNSKQTRTNDDPPIPIFCENITPEQQPQSIIIASDRALRFKFPNRIEVRYINVMRKHVPDLSDLDYIIWED